MFKKSFYLSALILSNIFFSQITAKVVGIKDGYSCSSRWE